MTSQRQLAVIIEKIASPAYHLFIILKKKSVMLGIKPRTNGYLKCPLTCQSGRWPPDSLSIPQSLPITGPSWLAYPAPYSTVTTIKELDHL